MVLNNEKILETRIGLKYDSYANWSDATKGEGKGANLVLKRGEVGFCYITEPKETAGEKNGAATTAPTVLFKVGDGTHKFYELKWVSALAADVYDWAKKSETEFLAWVKSLVPIEIIDNGTGKFVTDVTATNDENGHHITITRSDVALADITDKQNIALSADLGTVSTLTTTAKTAVGAINEHDAEIGNLASLSTENKSDLVTAINEVRQAVEVGGTGSVVTVRKDNENKYTVRQGNNDVAVSIEIADGTLTVKGENGLTGSGTFGANQAEDGTITLSHANTSDAANLVADGRKYVTGLTFDDYGHVTGYTTGTEADQHIAEYSIVKDATSEYAATYHLTKDGVNIGAAINIPKDMVVEKGEVKELEANDLWGDAGTYIVLTLSNATNDKLYINVGDLIEYVTSGSDANSQVIVSVSEDHKVTATIGAGKVGATELSTEVNEKINKAHTHANKDELDKFADGDKTKLDSAVQSASFAGTAFTKTGTELSITKDEAIAALGLGTASAKNEGYFLKTENGEYTVDWGYAGSGDSSEIEGIRVSSGNHGTSQCAVHTISGFEIHDGSVVETLTRYGLNGINHYAGGEGYQVKLPEKGGTMMLEEDFDTKFTSSLGSILYIDCGTSTEVI